MSKDTQASDTIRPVRIVLDHYGNYGQLVSARLVRVGRHANGRAAGDLVCGHDHRSEAAARDCAMAQWPEVAVESDTSR